jgi:hypothetical protein
MKKQRKTSLLANNERVRAGRKKKTPPKTKSARKKNTRRKRGISQSDKFEDDWQQLYFVHKSSSSAENCQHRSEERAMGNEAGTLHTGEAPSRKAVKSVRRRRFVPSFVPRLSFWCPKLMAHSRSYQVGT